VQYDSAGAGDLKGNINKKNYIGKLYYPIAIKITQKYRGYLRIIFGISGVIYTIGAKIGDFKVEYLRKFEAICKRPQKRALEVGSEDSFFVALV
jgi:hypothetical protein